MSGSVRLERLATRTPAAEATVRRLVEACGDYYELVSGRPPNAADLDDIFAAEVPGVAREDIQAYLVHDGDEAIGFAGLLLGWKRPGQSMIGLLAIDPARRRQGTGRAAVAALERVAQASPHGRSMRVGVVATNDPGLRFWHAMGYRETGERRDLEGFTAPIVLLEKSLDGA